MRYVFYVNNKLLRLLRSFRVLEAGRRRCWLIDRIVIYMNYHELDGLRVVVLINHQKMKGILSGRRLCNIN